jgi:hypothetical protein
MKGVEPLSFGLQDRRSVYPVELHRRNRVSSLEFLSFELLVDREGLKPSQKVCRTFMLSVTSPARELCFLDHLLT